MDRRTAAYLLIAIAAALFGTTFVAAHLEEINMFAGNLLEAHPWMLAVVLFFVCFATTRERVQQVSKKSASLWSDLRHLFANDQWILVVREASTVPFEFEARPAIGLSHGDPQRARIHRAPGRAGS